MWMVEEDPNAKIEIERLNAEIENLTPHKPESLEGVQLDGVEVDYLPIFCCCDGKVGRHFILEFLTANVASRS